MVPPVPQFPPLPGRGPKTTSRKLNRWQGGQIIPNTSRVFPTAALKGETPPTAVTNVSGWLTSGIANTQRAVAAYTLEW